MSIEYVGLDDLHVSIFKKIGRALPFGKKKKVAPKSAGVLARSIVAIAKALRASPGLSRGDLAVATQIEIMAARIASGKK